MYGNKYSHGSGTAGHGGSISDSHIPQEAPELREPSPLEQIESRLQDNLNMVHHCCERLRQAVDKISGSLPEKVNGTDAQKTNDSSSLARMMTKIDYQRDVLEVMLNQVIRVEKL